MFPVAGAPAPPSRPRWWRLLAIAGGLALGAGALLLFLGLGQLLARWRDLGVELRPGVAALALLLGIAYWGLDGLAWWATLNAFARARGAARQSFVPTLRVFYLGNVGRYLPGKLWYAASRGYLAERAGLDVGAVAAATVLELALIATSGAVVLLVGTPFLALPGSNVVLIGGLALALGLAAMHPSVVGWVLGRLARLRGTEAPTPPAYQVMLLLLVAYVGVWLVAGGALFATVAAIIPLSLDSLPAVVGVWGVAFLAGFIAPLTPSGLGVREATASVLLATLIPLPAAVAAPLLFRLILTLGELAFVVPFAVRSGMMLRR